MLNDLIITIISDDKPGIVENIARTVSTHQGNWLESRLAQLAGKFAGVIRIQVEASHIEALKSALTALGEQGIQIVVEVSQPALESTAGAHDIAFHVLGPDRPGIVSELTRTFAIHDINVSEMDTNYTSMPYSGEPLFEAQGVMQVPPSVSIHTIEEQLDSIANELAVDISLKPLQPQT